MEERNPYFIVENDKKILEYKNSFDEPIWFYMRRYYFSVLDRHISRNIHVIKAREINLVKITKYMLKALKYNFYQKRNFSKVSFIFYSVVQPIYIDDFYINKYTEAYVDIINNDCITIEDTPLDWCWIDKRKNKRVVLDGPHLLFSTAVSKLISKIYKNRKITEELYQYVLKRTIKLFKKSFSDEEKKMIIGATLEAMIRADIHSKWVLKICKKVNAKCVVMIGSSYLWNSRITRILKENGIVVADLQHGYIFKDNLVYDVSNEICDSYEIKKSTPNYYLSYGEWWNEQTNLPYEKKIPLGNPFREIKVNKFNSDIKKEFVLIIGSTVNTEKHMQLAQNLSRNLSQYQIVFRPHPTERVEAQKIYEKKQMNFLLDCGNDLYSMLERTYILVSRCSTVLFEAYGLVKKIYVWNDYPDQLLYEKDDFIHFTTQSELLDLIKEGRMMKSKINFWNNRWYDNFMDFYNECIC